MSQLSIPQRVYYGIQRRWRDFTFRPHQILREYAGEKIRLSIEDVFSAGFYGLHHNHWPEIDWIRQYGIKPGDTIVDCGANHGYISCLFARFTTPTGKVIAIEPIPRNARILRTNLSLNEITNCELHNCGAGAANSEMEIIDTPNATLLPSHSGKGEKIKVPIKTLDSIVNGGKVDFLKIDVEGYEREVLKGASAILAQRPRIDIELHVGFFDDKHTELAAIFDLLPLADYKIFLQMDVDGPIEPFTQDWRELLPVVEKGDIVHLFLC